MFRYTKDGISVFTILDTRRPKLDGKFPVKVQVIHNRVQKYYATGKSLTLDEWNKMPTTKNRQLTGVRENIENSFSHVRDAVEDMSIGGAFRFDALNTRLKRATGDTINTAFRARIAELKEGDMVGNMDVHVNVLGGIERFARDKLAFDKVTVDWLKRYEKFLLSEGKTITTISIHMRTIRAIFNAAKRAGAVREAQYPQVYPTKGRGP